MGGDFIKTENQFNKFYTCKWDWAFKEVMLNEKNKDLLKILLESILKVEISDIDIRNQERNSRNIYITRKHLDAILKTNIGTIEIEVNSSDKSYAHPRNMAYLCDIYSHHTLIGQNYDDDTLFIQINLSYGLKDNSLLRCYKIMDKDNSLYVKNFKIYELNMDKYKEFWYDNDKRKIEDNKYLIMLDLEPKDLVKLSKNDRMVESFMRNLEEVNQDPEFREYMSAEEDNRKIMNSLKKEYKEEGLKEGIEQGSLERSKTIALSMIKEGINIETISKCTGLSIEQINNIKKQ